jgi:hypothetical protein
MDIDHNLEPNIPDINSELDGPGFGDLDEVFQGSSGEGDGQVHKEGTPTWTDSDFIDWHPEPSQIYGRGYTFLDSFHSDENNVYHAANHYYPFSSQKDWEVASWLLHSGLSMAKIDSFLSLEMVSFKPFHCIHSSDKCLVKIKNLPLSFCSAKELRGRAEMLPSGPRWLSQVIPTGLVWATLEKFP